MRDQTSRIKANVILVTTQITTSEVLTAAVDRVDYEAVTIGVGIGTFTFTAANNLTIKLIESDDNITYTDVDREDVVEALRANTEAGILLNDTGDDEQTYKLGYIGSKQYVKAAIQGAAATDVLVESFAVLGEPNNVPTPLQHKAVAV